MIDKIVKEIKKVLNNKNWNNHSFKIHIYANFDSWEVYSTAKKDKKDKGVLIKTIDTTDSFIDYDELTFVYRDFYIIDKWVEQINWEVLDKSQFEEIVDIQIRDSVEGKLGKLDKLYI